MKPTECAHMNFKAKVAVGPYMERLGFTVSAVYVDRAKSGATVHERTDFQRMLRDAKAGGAFKAVCAETTSRYGRDEEDRAAARKRLTFGRVHSRGARWCRVPGPSTPPRP